MNDMTLGVTTCDKCGKSMLKGQEILTVGLSKVNKSCDEIKTTAPEIKYACHLRCWDELEMDK